MTSTNLVEDEIARFLKSSNPEVVCVRGSWGVGKTFTWQAGLNRAVSKKTLGLSRYSYVSLFGINALAELKLSIFENLELLISDEPDSLVAKGKSAANGMFSFLTKSKDLVAEVPYLGDIVKSANSLVFSAVRNQLICIDDLERRGAGLEVKDVLGLISFLKEQRKCKVVLLLNDGQLGDVGKAQFDDYFEKVIDVQLLFAPEPEDSVRIALPAIDDASKMLCEFCIQLRISNIRVIKKIERFVKDAATLLYRHDKRVFRQAVHSLALLGWSKFQPKNAPGLEFIKKQRGNEYVSLESAGGLTREEASWNALLDDYESFSLDEFDLELLRSLENGYFDEETLKRVADVLQTKLKQQDADGSFDQAWRKFHDSFADDKDEVLDAIYKSFKKTVGSISPVNLDGTIRIFRDLGREDQANELLAFYTGNRNEAREFWDLSEYVFTSDVTDQSVKQAFADKLATYVQDFDPLQVLKKIAMERSWNDHELAALAKTPVAEFSDIFKNNAGKDLSRLISAALQFDRIANASPAMKEIATRAKEALAQIGKESDINARRVRKYAVIVSAEEPENGARKRSGRRDRNAA